VEYTTN